MNASLPEAPRRRREAFAFGLSQAFLRMRQRYANELGDESLEPADMILLFHLATSQEWKTSLIELLLATTDDPQRVMQRAIEAGRLTVDDEGRLAASPATEALFERLFPIAQRLNLDWRGQLAASASAEELATFLAMLQHLSEPTTEEETAIS